MNLVAMKGVRGAYNAQEVQQMVALTPNQLKWAVQSGKLKRRGNKQFPYLIKDVNEFVARMNAGE